MFRKILLSVLFVFCLSAVSFAQTEPAVSDPAMPQIAAPDSSSGTTEAPKKKKKKKKKRKKGKKKKHKKHSLKRKTDGTNAAAVSQ